MIRFCGVKYVCISQVDDGENAVGVPQQDGSGLSVGTSAGILPRSKNQMLMPSSVHRVANTPPPLFANGAPYEFVDGSATTQP